MTGKYLDALKTLLSRDPRLYSLARSFRATWLHLGPKGKAYRERAARVRAIEEAVGRIEPGDSQAPVLFFDPSAHLTNLSLNAAVGLLVTWSLRLAGQPVVYMLCRGGIGKCVHGTLPANPDAPPPCNHCTAFSEPFYPSRHRVTLEPSAPETVAAKSMTPEELSAFRYGELELGRLCVPSARWILRRHDLTAVPAGQKVLAEYVASAAGLARRAERLLDEIRPRALLLFNGTFFPEATVRAVALARGIPVVTYEAGLRAVSAYFSHDVATDVAIDVPESFRMGQAEDVELDDYMSKRMQGDFTMAGVQFWPDIKGVSPGLKREIDAHRGVVTLFTNVVFDTSQVRANTVFDGMFDWLAETMRLAPEHPDTLFIVRAHPDELRATKASRETVGEWLERNGHLKLPNLVFVPPTDYVSSYELIRLSDFCIVYNSTVGLEAVMLGRPVVAGGMTKYSREGVTHAPGSREAYHDTVASFVSDGVPPLPEEWRQRARRFMYYMLFRASLDVSPFVEPMGRYDYTFRPFEPSALHPDNSEEMRIICEGIINNGPFYYRHGN